ncbi:interleukin-23 receptor isoform X2 [Genypterus blacodes]|uniref:interleukin-23 receptor isoform X2 n=1 Tax=Genypterus blacodes TaxID=154954 RepID=UPI003F776646
MNLLRVWSCLILFLLNASIKRCPVLLAGCNGLKVLGKLTVEPGPIFPLCSDLTLYCSITHCQWSFRIYLELDGECVGYGERINCSTVKFKLYKVCKPESEAVCKLKKDWPEIIGGLDLQGGLPPDQPTNIHCETSRNSALINCSWTRGRETHTPTTYSVLVSRENGTQIHAEEIQGTFTLARTMLDEDTKYQMIITAYNRFGVSKSEPFSLCVDVVIPDTPGITQIVFWNSSLAAMLYWKSPESSAHLRTYLRFSTDDGSWELREGTELTKGLIRVDGLKPLTEYAFQIRTCKSTSALTHTNNHNSSTSLSPSRRVLCSKWSPSARKTSPGKGPSQQLQVWRVLGSRETDGLQAVTVLWKPLSPEDYSGEVKEYIILDNDQKQQMTCAGDVSQGSVQVPPGTQTLSVSAVTSYGKSPLAHVPLRHSGVVGAALRGLAPAGGSAVLVSWSQPATEHWPTCGGEALRHYVIEWWSGSAGLHWQRVDRDQNSTFITGLTDGVRYNVSLYAVTSSCVSAPSSGLVYSQEQKPVCGPIMSALVHEDRRMQIQWDELPVYEQRGFITNYTIYLQTLDSKHAEHRGE